MEKMKFKLSDTADFQKYAKVGTTRKNRKNKARRRERKREWKENNPKPQNVERKVEDKVEYKKPEVLSVNDVIKAVSDSRKKVKR
ncbi:hypothetical protein [Treponema sp.]|uniref:hypothetical protein n=1 Tax=Treponema sp. TaxID=166 RepID=UPI00388DE6DA